MSLLNKILRGSLQIYIHNDIASTPRSTLFLHCFKKFLTRQGDKTSASVGRTREKEREPRRLHKILSRNKGRHRRITSTALFVQHATIYLALIPDRARNWDNVASVKQRNMRRQPDGESANRWISTRIIKLRSN